MSIQYSGNTAIYSVTTSSGTPALDIEAFLLTNLQLAGWTLGQIPAADVLTFTAQPANNSTIILDTGGNGRTYTFKTTLTPAAYEVLIDATLLATSIQNLKNAIIAGPGSGTAYGAGTVAHPTMNVQSSDATHLTVQYITSGSPGNAAPVSTGGTPNATWASSTLGGGLNYLKSVPTPQGLQCRVVIFTTSGSFYNPGTGINIYATSWDGVRVPPNTNSWCTSNEQPVASTAYKLIACKYQFALFAEGTASGTVVDNGLFLGVPFITSNLVAPTISAATNAAPIVCTISNHGFANADSVLIVNAIGNTAMNGVQTITFIDANTFSLDGTTGNGAYTSNSASCSDITINNTVCEAVFSTRGGGGGNPPNFRSQGYWAETATSIVNSSINGLDGGSTARLQIVTPGSIDNGLTAVMQWFDNTFLLNEPFIMWGITNAAQSKIIGQLWDAAMVRTALTVDQTAVFDSPSHTFWTVGTGNGNSLLLATTP